MSNPKVEEGIRLFLEGLQEDPTLTLPPELSQMLASTPQRVASAWTQDLLGGYRQDPGQLIEPIAIEGASGPVLLEGIGFTAVCAHHLLPFEGTARVGFVPDQAHTGLGNLARLVDCLARRLTLQETLTAQIADQLVASLAPKSVLVVLEARHACLSARGTRKTGHRFRTVERRGDEHALLERIVADSGAGFA